MLYELLGRIHAEIYSRLTSERGQGTVEYVALILLVAGVLAAVVVAAKKSKGDQGITSMIVKHIKTAINTVR